MLGLHKVHLVLGRLDFEQDPLNSNQHPLNSVLWGSSDWERKREGGRQNLEVDVLIDTNIVRIGGADMPRAFALMQVSQVACLCSECSAFLVPPRYLQCFLCTLRQCSSWHSFSYFYQN